MRKVPSLSSLIDQLDGPVTRQVLSDLARQLPDGYALIYGKSIGFDAKVAPIGVEGAWTGAYFPDGTIENLSTGSVTAGIDGLPVSSSAEIGIAWVGDKGVKALEGLSLTLEGGIVIGIGATIPISWESASYALNLYSALHSGNLYAFYNIFKNYPEGSSIQISSGLQGGVSLKASYTLLGEELHAKFIGSHPYESFDSSQYNAMLDYVAQSGQPATIGWDFDYDGVQYSVTQKVTPIGEKRGIITANIRTKIFDVTHNKQFIYPGQFEAFGLQKNERVSLRKDRVNERQTYVEQIVPADGVDGSEDANGTKPRTGTSEAFDQGKPIVIPRSTFNLFSDLTMMTTAALEREQRENRLAYNDLTDGEAYRVLTDGAGQAASRFEPGNRPDLDVAQTGDDVTLHGGGRFVPRGSSNPRDEVTERAIPEPRVKPETNRMLPDRSIPVPTAKPDLYGIPPDKNIPILRTRRDLTAGH